VDAGDASLIEKTHFRRPGIGHTAAAALACHDAPVAEMEERCDV
jgi:hypothetical protein